MEFLKLDEEADKDTPSGRLGGVLLRRTRPGAAEHAVSAASTTIYPVETAKDGPRWWPASRPAARLKDDQQGDAVPGHRCPTAAARCVWLGSGEMWRLRQYQRDVITSASGPSWPATPAPAT